MVGDPDFGVPGLDGRPGTSAMDGVPGPVGYPGAKGGTQGLAMLRASLAMLRTLLCCTDDELLFFLY